ncbi:serine/threonine-protein kinase [Rubrivivax benzoatilyticus]|uniref:Serine/threonine protein kinase n=1 Tax=Rubrivivax benzoatilyticus TaxID=316997 RepID=A0ABX0HZA3_9BURK|nr:serine/threonine-protein kinase [Rubrivivax benzoatilyticus]NHK98679.1 serine/threonine protein kinase [Rubrivivax benzoatilyticus]NHL24181.1 serine/threonine protein kinase [Rubrivivax benzoatilyticus]
MRSDPLVCGPVVGGYRLDGLIGSGQHGDVYLATHPDSGMQVAVKRLRLPAGDAQQRGELARRFVAEAQTTRRLDHPDIVRVLEAGCDEAGPWLVMELLHGCSLERYTRAARLLPEPVVVALVARVARALACAHAQGVVHRDLKPANVIVDWGARRVTLSDFGLARDADAENTRTGLVLGSPDYMAPEQLAGAAAAPAGDLYALGVMLFELLAGRRPHEAASLGELLQQVAQRTPPDLRTLRPELPPALCDLVAALLSKQPAARPASAAAVADALDLILSTIDSPRRGSKSRP